jgi:DNA-binding CsgD family transcriptional regulator
MSVIELNSPLFDRLAEDGLRRLQERLNLSKTASALFSTAAIETTRICGYGRAVVLDVDDDRLTAEVSASIPNSASEALRLRMLAGSLRLAPGSVELAVLRGDRFIRAGHTSILAERLGLDRPAFAAIAPEGEPVALIAADRPSLPERDARLSLALLAQLVAASLMRIVLHARLEELASEFRYLTTSAHALLHEARHTPINIPRDHGQGPAFGSAAIPCAARIDHGLSDREEDVMRLMAKGLANIEIAEQLNLSIETVKGYVRRILRKLGAANRVEAVVRYLQRPAA